MRLVLARLLRQGALLACGLAAASAAEAADAGAQLQVELGTHAGAVRRLAASPARDLVVTGGDDKSARLWSLQTGTLQQVLRPPAGINDGGRVYGVALHPQRDWVAIGGSTATAAGGHAILIHDRSGSEPTRRIDARAGDIKRLLWTTDGELLLAGYAGEHGVRAFDLEGREVFADRFDGGVYALAVAPGRLAAAGLDGSLRLYAQNAAGAGPRYTELWRVQLDANPVSLAFSPDSGSLAVGYFKPGRGPDVIDLKNRRVAPGVTPPALGLGTLMSVAWSTDGRRVYAGGDYPSGGRDARLLSFEPGSRTGDELETGAGGTLTDLLTLADGRVAFAGADGSWGIVDPAARKVALQRAELPDLDGARNLLLSADGRTLSWTLAAGRERVSFDLTQRVATPGLPDAPVALLPPLLRRGLFDAPSDWENHRNPQVNGSRVALAPDELSRAVALFPQGPDAVLGTSRALWRVGAGGAVLWRRQMHTEVRAVNVTADGRLIVAALLDGTIRIARASDGLELMAILMLKDRRWILWTADGHFDASVGADRLVGWAVNRADGSAADYYPAARFRERYHQPRYIDLLLQTLDPDAAARRHAEEIALEQGAPLRPPRDALPQAPPQTPPLTAALPWPASASAAVPPLFPVPRLPPLLQSPWRTLQVSATSAQSEVDIEVPVSVRSAASGGTLTIEARIDGLPGGQVEATLEPAADGSQRGRVRVRVPASAATLQLLARNDNGLSEAWSLSLQVTVAPVLGTLPGQLAAPTTQIPALQASPLPGASMPPLPSTAPSLAAALPNRPAAITTGTAAAAVAAPALAITAPAVAAPGPRLFVLTIGVSEYQRPQYRLRLAAKDAADFARLIQRQQGKLYREVVVRSLLDGEATRDKVLAALGWLARAGGKGDTFMVFMAGHGVNGSAGDYYFMTADARDEDLAASTVADSDMRKALRQIPGRTLLFIDTCHAGSALGETSGRNSELARFVNDMSDNGVVVFAASSGRQESLENLAWGNGAFTLALLQGLSGRADPFRKGRVTYKGLDYYVSEEVHRLTKGRQTPVSLSPFGVPDFELARL